jgi:hypothetical protein
MGPPSAGNKSEKDPDLWESAFNGQGMQHKRATHAIFRQKWRRIFRNGEIKM